jgi:hypothetical protein
MGGLPNSAPQLVYNEEPTQVSRARIREDQDRNEETASDMENIVDAPSAITRLFRGMEILGQFLKNHYGTTKNPVKDELINKILQSSLRTCLVSLNQTLQMQWMRSSGHGTKSLSERHQPGTV